MIRSRPAPRLCRALFAAAALAVGAAPSAARAQAVPDGIPVGPWILAPSFYSAVQIDDNLLRTPDNEDSDRTTHLGAELAASLPFKNSLLSLAYRARKEYFQEAEFPRTTAQDATVDLQLNFSSGDKLALRDRFRRDFSQFGEREQGSAELVFRGLPYNINRWEVELERDLPRRQGYLIRVRRVDLNYQGVITDPNFTDYRGFDTAFEYRQPLGTRWWTISYGSRRFNNYRSAHTEWPVGVPFQKEESDSLETGIRGSVGDGSYYFRVGYVDFHLDRFGQDQPGDEVDDLDDQTVAIEAGWHRRVGGRTALDISYERTILPSTYETYYINDDLITSVERRLMRYAELSLSARVDRVRYGSTGVDLVDCQTLRIEDFRWQLGSRLSWLFHEHLSFDLAGSHEHRSSNCDVNDYSANEFAAGIRVGWF